MTAFSAPDDFLGRLAHELRTPLSIIKEGTGQMLDGLCGELSPDQRRHLGLIDHNVKRLEKTITKLLERKSPEGGDR